METDGYLQDDFFTGENLISPSNSDGLAEPERQVTFNPIPQIVSYFQNPAKSEEKKDFIRIGQSIFRREHIDTISLQGKQIIVVRIKLPTAVLGFKDEKEAHTEFLSIENK